MLPEPPIIDLMIASGADPDARSPEGETLLHLTGDPEAIRKLLSHGADINALDIHPVHFAAIVATSVVIGANSPPMAPILFMACRIGRAPVHEAVGPALRMMACVALPVMVLTTFVPALSMALPRWLGLL